MRKKTIILLAIISMLGCNDRNNHSQSKGHSKSVQEKTFVVLGGEEQYVEMTGASDELPVLLFLHGGPGWPQTPYLRYFNGDLTKEMILVSWDQAGCGLSYLNNPNPKNLSIESLISDAHELTLYLKKKFKKRKIFLMGFSYGSVLGLQLAEKYPEDYHAYIGVSQLIDSEKNWDISLQWLNEQAQAKNDTAALKKLALIKQKDSSVCKTVLDCSMNRYWLLVKFNGTIFKPELAKEIEKAEHYYDEYKDYDWFEVYNYTCSRLGDKRFHTDLTSIHLLDVPVFMLAGRHDWNLPGIVAQQYLEGLKAPDKKFIWFEKSGHEPPEEEAELFNKTIIEIVKDKS